MNAALWFIIAAGIIYVMTQAKQYGNWPPPPNVAIGALAQAIAVAEGSPEEWNNPGDLTIGDASGFSLQTDTQGKPIVNSAGVVRFSNLADGVTALYRKLGRIQAGSSGVYSLSMSIGQFAETYTGGDNADSWAQVVSSELGLNPSNTVGVALGVNT